jgi:DNA polymerase III subunit delta
MLGSVASERELKPVYLLTGTDRPKIAVALQRLRARIGEDATEQLHAAEAAAADAVAACNALGLFGGDSRLVIVDGVEAWKAADVKELEVYLAAPAPTTVLALVGDGVKRDSALAKVVAKKGEILAYDVVKKQLPEWVGGQFARLGASADREACRALVEAVGEGVDDLASEIQKLATWAGGEQITRATVEELAVGRAETPIFAVTDAWGRRDVAATLRATESLLDRSHRTRSGELIRLVGSLVGHIGRVRRASRLADEGVRSSEIASRLKMHPFVAEKAVKQAANFSPEELAHATVLLATLDAGAKGGSRLPPEVQLERTIVEITRRPAIAG